MTLMTIRKSPSSTKTRLQREDECNHSLGMHQTWKFSSFFPSSFNAHLEICTQKDLIFHSFINCTSFRNFKSVWSSTLYATKDTNFFILWSLNPDQYLVIHYLICKMACCTLLGFQSLISPFTALGSHMWLIKVRVSTQYSVCFVPSLKKYKYTHIHLSSLYYNAVKWKKERKWSHSVVSASLRPHGL